jgi:tetratricopeptide (TPR) repeat protein
MRYTSYPHVMATILLCSMSLQGCQSALNALQEEPLSQERQVPGVCPQGDSTTLSIPLLHIVSPLAPHRTDDRTVTPVHPRVVVTPFVSGALGMLPTVSSAQRLTDGHHVSGATPIPDSLTKASYGPFTASNGDLVRFQRVGRQWQAVDLSASSAYASQRILPVVSAEALNSFLTWLKDQDRWTSRARIHVLHTSQLSCRSCVYVGKHGLLGGMRQAAQDGEEDKKSPANPTNVQDLVEQCNRGFAAFTITDHDDRDKNRPLTIAASNSFSEHVYKEPRDAKEIGILPSLRNHTAQAKAAPYIARAEASNQMRSVLEKEGICVVYGPGGSGKSTLAVHYAAGVTDRDDQQVTRFIPADSREKLMSGLRRAAEELGINHRVLAEGFKEDPRRYCERLCGAIYTALERDKQNAYFILDDVRDAELVKDCDLSRKKHKNSIKIIVTTRDPEALSDYDDVQVGLAGFSREEEKAYVAQRLEPIRCCYPPDERAFGQAVENLALGVGSSPLSLNLATSHIMQLRNLQTVEAYLEALRSTTPKPGIIPQVDMGLASLNQLAQQVMRYSTELDVTFIPLSLLSEILGGENCDRLEEILSSLERLSLVKVISNGKDTDLGIQIQQDVQKSCVHYRQWVEGANISESDLLGRLVAIFHERMPWVCSVPDDRWAAGELYAAHLERVLSKAPSALGDTPHLADLISRMGQYRAELGCDYQQSLTYQEQALKMRMALYEGQNHPEVATSLNNVGTAYNALGDVQESLRYQEQALKMRMALYGDQNHPDVAESLNSVGVAYERLGDAQKSLSYCEQALEMRKALYGDQPRSDIAESLNNVGATYHLLGDARKGLRYQEQALERYQALHGDQPHPEVATSLNNVGIAYETLGEAKKGLSYQEQALKMRKALYEGQNHPDVAKSLNGVGVAYEILGEVKKGLSYQEQALKMRKALYGDQPHPDIARSLNSVGTAYNALGDVQQGLTYQEQALKMRKTLYGNQNRPDIAESLNNMGVAYSALGDTQKGLTYFEQALAMKKALYGEENHPEVASSLNSVGVAYEILGEAKKGLRYQEQALEMYQALYGDQPHPDLAMSLSNVGIAYETLGDVQESLRYQEQALKMRRALYRNQPHPEVAKSLSNVGAAYNAFGDVQEGLSYQEQALRMRKALYGDQPHPDLATSLNDVGAAYNALGEAKKGLRYQEQALEMYQALYGNQPHPDLATSLSNVGIAYETLGDVQESLSYQEQALKMHKALYRNQPHPEVAKSLSNVGAAYNALGDVQESLRYQEQALRMRRALYEDQPHPDLATSLNNVGTAYNAVGDVQESRRYQEQALRMRRALYIDQPHPDLATSLNDVGAAYNALEDVQRGLSYQKQALKMRRALYGDRPHPDLATSLNDVGAAYNALGEAKKGLRYQEQALKMRRALYGDQPHPDLATSLKNVGAAYNALGDVQKGLKYREQALEMREILYGWRSAPS